MATCLLVACGGGAQEASDLDIAGLCAKTAQCPGTDFALSLTRCHDRALAAERKRDRTVETSQTSDLVDLAWLDCITAANGDCAEVEECIRPSRVSEDVCDGEDGFHERCDRNVAVSCWASGRQAYRDCRAAGLVCDFDGGEATCVHADDCVEDTCDGDVLVRCLGGVSTRSDCRGMTTVGCSGACKTRVFETCGERDGAPACVAAGETCDEDTFTDACDGDAIATCSRGNVGRRDCASEREGVTCKQDDNPGLLFCGVDAPECEFGDAESCTDGVISYCVDATLQAFDCATIGASACETRTEDFDVSYEVCTSG